jgi:hypothetical protein
MIVTRVLAARSVTVQRLGRNAEEFAWLVAMLATPLRPSLSGSVVMGGGKLEAESKTGRGMAAGGLEDDEGDGA